MKKNKQREREGEEDEHQMVSSLPGTSPEGCNFQDSSDHVAENSVSDSSITLSTYDERSTALPGISDARQVCILEELAGPGLGPDLLINGGLARQLQVRTLLRRMELLEQQERDLATKEKALEVRYIQLEAREQALQQREVS